MVKRDPTKQLRVTSSDGTPIAVWVTGVGPPMVLVHGSFGDHTAWEVPLEVSSTEYTAYAMDRRGFGASGDESRYSIESEFDDVAAVADAVAAEAGEPVILWGHSYGANCAMGGASRSDAVRHLVLYEPSLGLRYPEGAVEAAEALLADGDRAGAIERILIDVLEMTTEAVAELKGSARWPNLLANAHTAPRECRVEETWVYQPGQFAAIEAPTLLLSGTDSPDAVHEATARAADAIQGSSIVSLEGQGHFAHRTDPVKVLGIIRDFVSSR